MLRILLGTAMVMAACCSSGICVKANARELCSHLSLNSGKAFVSVITAEAVERTPAWKESDSNPPLSAREAMQLADKLKDTLLDDTRGERRARVAMELRRATEDHWYWLARYELEPDAWSGPLPDLIILVLMDGTVVTPRIYPERKYRSVSGGGGLNEEGFYVHGSAITNAELTHLEGLSRAECIHLSSSKVTDAGLMHLKKLTQLKALSVVSPAITDGGVEHLHGLEQLEYLTLQCPQITDSGLKQLGQMTRLRNLYLQDCTVTGSGCEYLKGLGNLQDLTMCYGKIKGAGLGSLKDLGQLKSLDLEGNPLDDVGMRELSDLVQLQVLNLSGTPVTDAGLQNLMQLKQLVRLYLRDTVVTEDGVKLLQNALPDCEVVR